MQINSLMGCGTSMSYNPGNNIDYKISCRGRKCRPATHYRHGTPVNTLFTHKHTGEKTKRRAVRVAGEYYLESGRGWRNCRKLAAQYGYDFEVLGRFGRKEG